MKRLWRDGGRKGSSAGTFLEPSLLFSTTSREEYIPQIKQNSQESVLYQNQSLPTITHPFHLTPPRSLDENFPYILQQQQKTASDRPHPHGSPLPSSSLTLLFPTMGVFVPETADTAIHCHPSTIHIINERMLLAPCAKIIKTVTTLAPTSFRTWGLLLLLKYPSANSQTASAPLPPEQQGTDYSNWVLARSASARHQSLSYLRRKQSRDRFSIHKLTNMDFMCSLATRDDKYALRLNEKIVLLAQMNHVCNVLKKDKGVFTEFGKLSHGIAVGLGDPEDYICAGTYINSLVDLGEVSEGVWVAVMDALLVRKYDEEYDELFGLYSGLHKYRALVEEFGDYFQLQRNKVIYNIPVVYRNSLETVRQFIRFNTYNLKQCRILLRCLHQARINDRYFWGSVGDWFSLYIKEQLQQKEFQEFFIVAESGIERVLFDDGLIRPRSILEEVSEIAFILSQHGCISQRYITFIENLIIYTIENGSQIFIKFLQIEKSEAQREREKKKLQKEREGGDGEEVLNEHLRMHREEEQAELLKMETKYRTLFVNPTDLRSETVIQALIVIKRAYEQSAQEQASSQGQGEGQGEGKSRFDQNRSQSVDSRVLSWLAVRLCQAKMKYTVNELLKIIECRHILGALRVDLRGLILEKVKDVRQKDCSMSDLRELFLFLPLMEYESIAYLLEHFLSRAHPKEILQLTQLFEAESMSPEDYEHLGDEGAPPMAEGTGGHSEDESQMDRSHLSPKEKNKRWMPYLTTYFLRLPGAVNNHERYYSFEENCYFLYLLLKNEEYWQRGIDYVYLGEMEKLKHSIKIASYSRGFKLQMGTYFYKLMNYIDLVAFFDGGA